MLWSFQKRISWQKFNMPKGAIKRFMSKNVHLIKILIIYVEIFVGIWDIGPHLLVAQSGDVSRHFQSLHFQTFLYKAIKGQQG